MARVEQSWVEQVALGHEQPEFPSLQAERSLHQHDRSLQIVLLSLLYTDIDNLDILFRFLFVHPHVFNHMYYIHAFGHSTKHGMFPI